MHIHNISFRVTSGDDFSVTFQIVVLVVMLTFVLLSHSEISNGRLETVDAVWCRTARYKGMLRYLPLTFFVNTSTVLHYMLI